MSRLRNILATLAALIAPSISDASVALDASTWSYATVASVMLALIALAGSFVAARGMRRELERQASDVERERSVRLQTERRLQLTEQSLDDKLDEKQSELDNVYRQLEATRTRLDALETRLTRIARVDELTGIANRRRFDEALDDEIKRMVRDRSQLSIIICEVDYLDEFIASRGRERCADALSKIARALERTFRRAGDLVARYGSARFAIVMPATDQKTATQFAERLVERIYGLCIVHDRSEVADRITMSAGVATMMPNKLRRAEDIVEAAETALEDARHAGFNQAQSTLLN